MLLRGAETPKSKFTCFRVARKQFKRDDKKAPQILVCEAYIIHILILSIQGNGSLCEV